MSERYELELLRRFEPVIRYTRGERFFPMDVEPYIRSSSLWMKGPYEEATCLLHEGELTPENLGEQRVHDFESVLFMQFIEPLNVAELAAYEVKRVREGFAQREGLDVFRAGMGRLARVGYLSRFIDAIFSISLLARGRVPGDTAAAAALAYEKLWDNGADYRYYGRVVRQEGWIILQYWFFYAFNNWRSGFFGVNDHESDWEQICIYLYDRSDGEVEPAWVAYASHDFEGDDLRRRWDDPEVERVGEHPVIYAGAGSHASYYAPGEYLAEIEIGFLAPLVRVTERLKEWWRGVLRQVYEEDLALENDRGFNIFRIPFVDYARGDGFSIGPGQDAEWTEPGLLMEPLPGWAFKYRGLWGLYAEDFVSGEDAPAGPLYDRDGTLRRAWYDPLGWAGLSKLPPPEALIDRVEARRDAVEREHAERAREIDLKGRKLRGLGIEAQAMRGHPHLQASYAVHQERIAELSRELAALREAQASDTALLEVLDEYATKVAAGYRGALRDHIERAHAPATEQQLRMGRVAEVWAALSIGLLLVAFVALAIFSREHLIGGLIVLLTFFVFIEAGFRGRLQRLISSVSSALALVAALILLFEFFWEIVVILVLIAGIYLIFENVGELWR
jgi:hypothetical protein